MRHSYFPDCLEKRDFFLQTNPNIDILYIIKNNFSPRLTMRDRYLKIRLCFGSDQLSKFHQFVQKCVLSIRAFSSRVEGTIRKRRPRGTDLHPEMVVGVARDGIL